MFYGLNKRDKWIVSGIIMLVSYAVLTLLFSSSKINSANSVFTGIFSSMGHIFYAKLPLSAVIVFLCVFLRNDSLDIQAKRVGQGQHGSAQFMTAHEIEGVYQRVSFGSEKMAGILVGHDTKTWLVDDSDHNLLLLAPPGGGKTKRIFIPSIYYNAQVNKNYIAAQTKNDINKGTSMVIMDIKGELYRSCKGFLDECGYETPVLNFRDISLSDHYQIMYNVNRAIDKYKAARTEGERAIYYGQAERYAKILSTSLVENVDGGVAGGTRNETSEYFNDTSKGLLTGIILLVSEYAAPEERYILSVYSLLLETNGVLSSPDNKIENQKSKLVELLDKIDNKRILNYTGAATSADARTIMNVFSSALSRLTKFIDAELEQILCDQSERLNDIDFINKPTAIFLICPDENTTRHFFASLFLRYFSNDLIEQAENIHNGILPRKVIFFCDEFGNLPPIHDVDVLFAAIRGRGIRIVISLQSYNQLYKSYSKEKAEIIKDTCQMVMSGFVAPSAHETAKTLSDMLGNETVMTGSVSKNDRSTSTTQSMVGKPLLSVSDWVTLPHGTYILQKGGYDPMKTEMKLFFDYLQKIQVMEQTVVPPLSYTEIKVSDVKKLQQHFSDLEKYKSKLYKPITKGMFD